MSAQKPNRPSRPQWVSPLNSELPPLQQYQRPLNAGTALDASSLPYFDKQCAGRFETAGQGARIVVLTSLFVLLVLALSWSSSLWHYSRLVPSGPLWGISSSPDMVFSFSLCVCVRACVTVTRCQTLLGHAGYIWKLPQRRPSAPEPGTWPHGDRARKH